MENTLNSLDEALAEIQRMKLMLEEANAKIAQRDAQIGQQEEEIRTLNEKLAAALEAIENEREKKTIAQMRMFGKKTEKSSIIFNEAEEIINSGKKKDEEDGEEEEQKIPRKKRHGGRKKGGKNYEGFDFEAHVTRTVILESETKTCPKCGSELVAANDKTRYKIDYIPGRFEVTKYIIRSKKCPNCNKVDNTLYPAPGIGNAFGSSALTSSSMSEICYSKFGLGIPLNRLSEHLSSQTGLPISKQLMADCIRRCAELCKPLYDAMKESLLKTEPHIIHVDETPVIVSDKYEPTESEQNLNRQKSYLFVYASPVYSPKRIFLYEFHETRAAVGHMVKWLKDFHGYLVGDDFPAYPGLQKRSEGRICFALCWEHAIRRFVYILKATPEEKREDTFSGKFVRECRKLFAYEKQYRKEHLTPDERKRRRLAEHPPILHEIWKMITSVSPKKGSELETAVNYFRSNYRYLVTYLRDGHVDMTNNTAERGIRPFSVQRKSFQCAGSYQGARHSSVMFTLVQNALLNGLDVRKYIGYVFENIKKAESMESLMPYSDEMKRFRTKELIESEIK